MLSIDPGRCDGCMGCVRACPRRAVTVGSGYVFVDWDVCDGCLKCLDACDSGALARRASGHAAEGPAVAAGGEAPALAPEQGALPARLRPSAVTAKRETEPVTQGWEGWEVAVILGGALVLFLMRQAFINSEWMRVTVPMGAKPIVRAGVLALYYAGQLALLVAVGARKRTEFAASFGLRRTSVLLPAALVAVLVVATRVFAALYLVTLDSVGLHMPDVTDLTRYFGRDAIGFALTVLMVVIVGPLFEEVVFRGVLLGYLQERYGAWWAILGASLLFAAYHFNAWTFVPVAVMGFAAGWLAVRFRSLWPAYALHLGYNAIAVVLTFAIALR
jgi:membrane protease YdiL (CAAX protease family)/NAD-dependent dihydropyrimidine dehydrogenase PreA subunit